MRALIMAKYGCNVEPCEKPTALIVEVVFQIPKSFTKAQRKAAQDGAVLPTARPDCDNILKLIADGCNGLLYLDDKDVIEMRVSKRYARDGEEAHVRAIVQEVEE
jgi:Holliday junction resolvase RusA-like endonuclease